MAPKEWKHSEKIYQWEHPLPSLTHTHTKPYFSDSPLRAAPPQHRIRTNSEGLSDYLPEFSGKAEKTIGLMLKRSRREKEMMRGPEGKDDTTVSISLPAYTSQNQSLFLDFISKWICLMQIHENTPSDKEVKNWNDNIASVRIRLYKFRDCFFIT